TPTRAWNALTTLVFALKASWLQRGHAHAGVECRGTFKTRIQIRRFNGATPTRAWNGFLSPTRRPFSPCFNGATPTRAWNDGNGGEIALTMGALQRGHAHAGVEWGAAHLLRARPLFASTGPRPRGRGMCLVAPSAHG